jgi:hypothetical protein
MIDRLRHSGFKRMQVVVCLAAVLLVVLAGTGDFVLCFGEDGHIAFEAAHDVPCEPRTSRNGESSAPDGRSEIGTQRYSCFDVPITAHNLSIELYHQAGPGKIDNGKYAVSSTSVLPASCGATSAAAGMLFETLHRKSPPPLRQALGSLHAVVLII